MPQDDVIYMFAMSLDGYIARPDGSFDWLESYPANADFDFDAFLASVTGIVMGRASYDAARSSGGWDYAAWPCVVATSRPIDDAPDGVEAVSGIPAQLLDRLRARGATGRIWLFGGGDLARRFLDAGLLDTIEIGTIPVILGKGLPAFGAPDSDIWLDMNFAAPLANGAVHTQYRVRTRRAEG
ncbi:dihydrofolate reductase family protein [Mesorhizobium sp. CAU 1732]|uniref:dihydrofolate reductase family protein n=1 Tax=Mesorhizobium sp. CAU 1732 TaxID=3140358 RepID=UPI0032618674